MKYSTIRTCLAVILLCMIWAPIPNYIVPMLFVVSCYLEKDVGFIPEYITQLWRTYLNVSLTYINKIPELDVAVTSSILMFSSMGLLGMFSGFNFIGGIFVITGCLSAIALSSSLILLAVRILYFMTDLLPKREIK